MTDARSKLVTQIRQHGTNAIAKKLGVSGQGLLAYALDVPRQRGTDALIEQRLPQLDGEGPQAA